MLIKGTMMLPTHTTIHPIYNKTYSDAFLHKLTNLFATGNKRFKRSVVDKLGLFNHLNKYNETMGKCLKIMK